MNTEQAPLSDTSLIDTHCHLDFSIFDQDRDAVLARAKASGIKHIIIPGVIADAWPTIKSLTVLNTTLSAAYGLHPMFMHHHTDDDIGLLHDWVDQEKPIAIGECGLDFFIDNPDREGQLRLFEAQVKLAYETQLPLIIHARKSLDLVLKILKQYKGVRGVIHSFSGSEQQAQACLKSGLYFGLGGSMTHSRATRLRALVSTLPMDSIVLETDAPDQAPASHKGERNEPSYLPSIVEQIAYLRNCDIKDVTQCTLQNTKDLFGTGMITP